MTNALRTRGRRNLFISLYLFIVYEWRDASYLAHNPFSPCYHLKGEDHEADGQELA